MAADAMPDGELKASLVGVTRELLPMVWPHVADMITEACELNHGRYGPDDIRRFLDNQDMQLWMAVLDNDILAVMITEIVVYARMKCCRICIMTGNHMAKWVHLMPQIEQWARDVGCSRMESDARQGWQRVLARQGWESTHLFIEKGL